MSSIQLKEPTEDELVELMRMVIRCKILNVDDEQWDEYEWKRGRFWIWRYVTDILLRDDVLDLVTDDTKFRYETAIVESLNLYARYLNEDINTMDQIRIILLRQLHKLRRQMSADSLNLTQHYVVCCWIEKLFYKEFNFSREDVETIVNYLSMALTRMLPEEFRSFSTVNELYDREFDIDIGALYHSRTECARFTTYSITRHCLGICLEKVTCWNHNIQFEHNRLSARAVRLFDYENVSSAFAVSTGVFYYEAILLTPIRASTRIGWGTKEYSAFDSDLGNDANSVALDLFELNIHNNNEEEGYDISDVSGLKSAMVGDVIGCRINAARRQFDFYLNGIRLRPDPRIRLSFSPEPYYACATLYESDHILFNFGQFAFRYIPDDIRMIRHFHEASNRDVRRYQLKEKLAYDARVYREPVIDNGFERFYQSQTQEACNQLVLSEFQINIHDGVRFDRFDGNDFLRIIQSIIEILGNVRYVQPVTMRGMTGRARSKRAAMAQAELLVYWFGRFARKRADNIDDHASLFCELIYPYLQLNIRHRLDIRRHRMICLVLFNMCNLATHKRIVNFSNILSLLFDDIHRYLTRTLAQTADPWTKLFAVLALKSLLRTVPKYKDQLRGIISGLKDEYISYQELSDSWLNRNQSSVYAQLSFCCSELLRHLDCPPEDISRRQNSDSILNPNDTSKEATISDDMLGVRSDWAWQSVRSTCSVSSDVYYYEVLLLTGGPMRIGWATRRTDLDRNTIGKDRNSIAFDCFNRLVRHNRCRRSIVALQQSDSEDEFSIKRKVSMRRCKAGDVIGCLLDASGPVNRYHFYLNGHEIHYQTAAAADVYSSRLAYHAAVSLGQHQQCRFNFGQQPFRCPPRGVQFVSFHERNVIGRLPPLHFSLTAGSIAGSIVNIGTGSITAKQITMNGRFENNITVSKDLNQDRQKICNKCQIPFNRSQLIRFDCCDVMSICIECANDIGDLKKCFYCK